MNLFKEVKIFRAEMHIILGSIRDHRALVTEIGALEIGPLDIRVLEIGAVKVGALVIIGSRVLETVVILVEEHLQRSHFD